MARSKALPVDARDLLAEFADRQVRCLIVGAYALAVHGYSRGTADIDLLVAPEPDNARRVMQALLAFGAPVQVHGLRLDDLTRIGTVYQIGLPPHRIDILTSIDGVDFETAWQGRRTEVLDGLDLAFLGRAELLANKRSTGRPQDLADAAALERLDADPA